MLPTPVSAEGAVEADSVAADAELPKKPAGAGDGAPESGGTPGWEVPKLGGALVAVVVVFAVVPLSTGPVVDADAEGALPPEEATDTPPVELVLVFPEAPAPVELTLRPVTRAAGGTTVTRMRHQSQGATKKYVLSSPATI